VLRYDYTLVRFFCPMYTYVNLMVVTVLFCFCFVGDRKGLMDHASLFYYCCAACVVRVLTIPPPDKRLWVISERFSVQNLVKDYCFLKHSHRHGFSFCGYCGSLCLFCFCSLCLFCFCPSVCVLYAFSFFFHFIPSVCINRMLDDRNTHVKRNLFIHNSDIEVTSTKLIQSLSYVYMNPISKPNIHKANLYKVSI
jgi:hypothetical protein